MNWTLYTQATGKNPMVKVGDYDTKRRLVSAKNSMLANNKRGSMKAIVYRDGEFFSSNN